MVGIVDVVEAAVAEEVVVVIGAVVIDVVVVVVTVDIKVEVVGAVVTVKIDDDECDEDEAVAFVIELVFEVIVVAVQAEEE